MQTLNLNIAKPLSGVPIKRLAGDREGGEAFQVAEVGRAGLCQGVMRVLEIRDASTDRQ